jgi:CxxC motif-containing protein
MKTFTEINQFRNVIREVKSHWDYQGKDNNGNTIYLHDKPYPTLKFRGTVKNHGTNSAIVKYKNWDNDDNLLVPMYKYEFQSRERVLTLTEDNCGFMNEMFNKNYIKLFENIKFEKYCAIYGEWCGKGIQKGVAISELPKMFIIFAVKIDDIYQDIENFKHLKIEEERIFNILQFKTYSIDIDFNQPELIQNKLIELTTEVGNECPVGKYFGVNGIGEGIVWEYINDKKRYIFKVKDERHQNSKVKTLTTIDVEAIKNINEFIEYAVTENRLLQGVDKMKELNLPIDIKSTADYLKWIYNDVVKEENDTIIANSIDIKKIGGAISTKARKFWLNYLNTNQEYI